MFECKKKVCVPLTKNLGPLLYFQQYHYKSNKWMKRMKKQIHRRFYKRKKIYIDATVCDMY